MELTGWALASWMVWKGVGQQVRLEERELGQPETYGAKRPAQDKFWPQRPGDGQGELTRTTIKCRTEEERTLEFTAEEEVDDFVHGNELDAIVVGGAAAGLAVAACLKKKGVKYMVVEKNERAGDIWRSRYHRLHLHDTVDLCHLPYFDMPGTFPIYVPRRQFARYLDAYENVQGLNVRHSHLVTHAKPQSDGAWQVEIQCLKTGKVSTYKANHLVLAYGIYNDPKIPTFQGMESFPGRILHSSRYTNAKDLGFVGKRVLVIGWGNSGCEISCDLVEHGAIPTILVRGPQGVVPRGFIQKVQSFFYTQAPVLAGIPFGWIPILAFLAFIEPFSIVYRRLVLGDITKLGFNQSWKGAVSRSLLDIQPPVMDIGTVQAAKDKKLQVQNGSIEAIQGSTVTFTDGKSQDYDAIVLATGYEQFSAHQHFMDKEVVRKIGTGVDGMMNNLFLFGNESRFVRGLWCCYGNLAMINSMSRNIAEKIHHKVHGRSLLLFYLSKISTVLAQHLVVLYIFKRYLKQRK